MHLFTSGQEMHPQVEPKIANQRLYALNWLAQDKSWDEVTCDSQDIFKVTSLEVARLETVARRASSAVTVKGLSEMMVEAQLAKHPLFPGT